MQSISQLCTATGVDPAETRKRLLELEKQKLVTLSPDNADRVSLTVKGYNAFTPTTLETSLEKKASRKKQSKPPAQTAQPITTSNQSTTPPETTQPPAAQEHEAVETKAPAQQTAPEPATATKPDEARHEQHKHETREHRVDLGELLARGAPRQKQALETGPEPTRASSTRSAASNAPSQRNHDGEKCALCKTGFVITVKGDQASFAHCPACGAAYHKDCYETITAGASACVHCGRRLDSVMDKRSYDVVKQLKDAFE